MLVKNSIYSRTLVLFICIFLAQSALARIIYVDADANGANGRSWADAYNSLQKALGEASSGDKILVAQGVYKPSKTGNREESFTLIDGITLKGGYAGFAEPNHDARDIDVYKTILSGDLNGDDVEVANPEDLKEEPTRAENSYHVVDCELINESTFLEGFTITGGYANGTRTRDENGGGMYNVRSSPKIIACTFSGNYTKDNGGGMYNLGGSPEITNCSFSENSAKFGGGMYNDMSSPTVLNCTFSDNSARQSGGGMYNDDSDSVLLSCRFVGNLSTLGGGMFNSMGAPNLTNCTFSGNRAESGGGMYNDNDSRPTLTNCTFSKNLADRGGGTFNIDADPDFTNCILWRNSDSVGTDELAQIYMYSGTPTINYCCVQGWTGQWPGEGNIHSDPLFVYDDGEDELHLSWNSPCIDAGDNNAVLVEHDYDGNPRKCDGFVDMGAFEFCIPPGLYEIIYVDADANGANDGTSWGDAFTCLQDAIDEADTYPEQVGEIRVAKGLYTPTKPNGPPEEKTFQLILNVAIKGGYAGFGKPDPNAWDPDLYETILSGDINGDDANVADLRDLLTEPTRADNSFHVVTGSDTDANAVLDGFTITGGMADGLYGDDNGGGMYIFFGNPTVIRCTFRGNCANGSGGGIFCNYSGPSIQNCKISRNFAGVGAGICCLYSWPTITENVIADNIAIDDGGGIYCDHSSPSITSNTIEGNWSDLHGGGIFCKANSELNIFRNTIAANRAIVDGGGIYCDDSDANIINNYIYENIADDDGGGICIMEESSPTIIRNNTIARNRANPQGGGIFCENSEDSEPVITNCIIWENGDDLHDYISGEDCNATYSCIQDRTEGLGNISLAPYFVDPDNGNYHLQPYSPCIDAGDPNSDYSMEPAPNGERVNMGAYGNTKEAATKSDDLDGDGMPDGDDLDVDEMPDGWEVAHFGDTSAGPYEDADGDNLTNLQEYQAGTDPHVAYDGLKKEVYVSIYANAGDPNADGTREHPFPTIQQGINAAQEEATIRVTWGTFNEPLIIDSKVLYIYGGYELDFSPSEFCTILNTQRDGRALLYVNVPRGGMLSGFLITNCYERDGAGMYFFNSSPTITDNIIMGNESKDDGGGISFYFGSDPLFEHNEITGNYANDNAGGIYCRDAAPEIRNCLIRDNQAEDGGGIRLRNSNPLIIDCYIINNLARDAGGGILCRQGSEPNIINCNIWNNTADGGGGGGIRSVEKSSPTISDCRIEGNIPEGVWISSGKAQIKGMVEIISNDWVSRDLVLDGDGELHTASGVVLKMDNCKISCDLTGEGTLKVAPESKLTIEGENTYVNMTEPGGIESNGLLVIKDSVCVEGSRIDVTRASFEGDVNITNSVIKAEAGAPYGQFFIENSVKIIGNDIHADGDRYMDLDPSVFDGLVENNRIYVRITEGKNQSRGGLFELRGQDDLVSSACGDDEFLCKVDLGTIPVFDLKSWTLEELTLENGAKVNLTNRFDFQPPYDSGGDEEVLYVRKLVLGEGAVLNTAFNKIYYETLTGDPCEVVHVPLLGFSLNNIAFDDQIEFVTRIVDNNFDDPNADESADYTRIHVARVEGLAPDPNGMMRMCNLKERDTESQTPDQVFQARAKGLFAKSSEEEILIQFEYLFDSSEPSIELVIYLTDVPELLDPNDPNRQDHYIEVARLPVPPTDRPGSPGSGRFGVFHKYVSRGGLNFIRGTRIELELVGPAGACVLINNWDPLVIGCHYGYCGDLNFDTGCTVLDFQIAKSYTGSETELLADPNINLYCLDFGFCEDGYVDLFDAESWAWMASVSDTVDICELPLSDSTTIWSSAKFTLEDSHATGTLSSGHSEILPANSLLVTGKSGAFTFAENPNNLLKDGLFVFDNEDGHFIEARQLLFDETNGRLVKGPNGEIYQVNHKEGLIRLSDNELVVSPGTFYVDFKDPRYGLDAEVCIGLSCHDGKCTGRPILDAAFDAAGNIYIVPVVVVPNGAYPYQAAARLQQVGLGHQQWEIVLLYDNPPLPNDNRGPDNLREIEVDDAGNVYVANSQRENESDALRVFEQDTGMLRNDLNLGDKNSDYYIPGPLAMHVSTTAGMLYLASSKNEPDANSTSLYVFSTEDLSLDKTIEIVGMGHIVDITEDLTTGTIWVVGFTIDQVPDYSKQIEEHIEPFYKPYLARIPHPQGVVNPVSAISVSQTANNDITLPLSILWTGSSAEICTRTDIDDSGAVNMVDFALLAARWLDSGCEFSDWCGGVDLNLDGNVTSDDLLLFCNCWLHQDP